MARLILSASWTEPLSGLPVMMKLISLVMQAPALSIVKTEVYMMTVVSTVTSAMLT